MGPQQITMFLHSKRNKETDYRIGKIIFVSYSFRPELLSEYIQNSTTYHQNNKTVNDQLNRYFSKEIQVTNKYIKNSNILNYQLNANEHYIEIPSHPSQNGYPQGYTHKN